MKSGRGRPQPSPPRVPAARPVGQERPVGWLVVFALGLTILAAPAWLSADPLGGFRWNETPSGLASQVVSVADPLGSARLWPDDLAFAAASRSTSALGKNLFAPADGQAVPLFRAFTAVLTRVSGNLEGLATILAMSSYAALFAVIAFTGHFVAREDQRLALALAAMAGVGASSVLEPTTARFALSRSLWAGLAALAMLIMLQDWRSRGGSWRLAVALAASFAAPLSGPGGFAAGPAGLAYLLTDGRPRCRKAAGLPLCVAAVASFVGQSGGFLGFKTGRVRDLGGEVVDLPGVLIFQNLGLDVPITTVQGSVLILGLVAVWIWSRAGSRPNPLEAAGVTLAVVGLWRNSATPAVAVIGAVLFAAGWWSGCHGQERDPSEPITLTPPTRIEAVVLLAMLTVLCVAETPRFRRLARARVYPLSPYEATLFPIPTLQWWRTKILTDDLALRQSQFFKRLDRVEALCRSKGVGITALRTTFGSVSGPGLSGEDALRLLDLPEIGRVTDPGAIRAIVGPALDVEPEPRPQWLPPGEPWPPAEVAP